MNKRDVLDMQIYHQHLDCLAILHMGELNWEHLAKDNTASFEQHICIALQEVGSTNAIQVA